MTEKEYQALRANVVIQNAVVNVTDDCNLRCPYCFTEANRRVISLNTMKTAIQFLISECTRIPSITPSPSVYFFGGEPMLHFEDIIVPTVVWSEESGLRKQHNISFGMTTNGTLLTEGKLEWLAAHDVGILLSMDGDRLTQDSQRPGPNGTSSFDMLAPKLPSIIKYFPNTTFRSTIEPYNVEHLHENYMFARKSGFKNYFVTPNTLTAWTTEQIKALLEQLSLIAKTMYEDISDGIQLLIWNEFASSLGACFTQKVNREIGFNHCGIGTTTVGIAVNGDINGCQEHNTYIDHDIFYIGNIFDGIDSGRHQQLLSAYSALPHPVCKENPSLCDSCSFYDDCAGHFCPSHNLLVGSKVVENSLVSCVWNNFVKELSFIILEQTASENNAQMISFLKDCVTK